MCCSPFCLHGPLLSRAFLFVLLFMSVFSLWHWQWGTFSSREKLVSAPKNEFPGICGRGRSRGCGSLLECCTLRGLSTAGIKGKCQQESRLWTCQYKGRIHWWVGGPSSVQSPFALCSRNLCGDTLTALV